MVVLHIRNRSDIIGISEAMRCCVPARTRTHSFSATTQLSADKPLLAEITDNYIAVWYDESAADIDVAVLFCPLSHSGSINEFSQLWLIINVYYKSRTHLN